MMDILGIFFPVTFAKFSFFFLIVTCLLLVLAVTLHTVYDSLQGCRYEASHLFQVIQPNWTPTRDHLLWIQRVMSSTEAGFTLNRSLQLFPPPGKIPPPADLPLEDYMKELYSAPSQREWERVTFRLLARCHSAGLSTSGMLKSLVEFQELWLNTCEEIQFQLKPVWIQLITCIVLPGLVTGNVVLMMDSHTPSLGAILFSGALFLFGLGWTLQLLLRLRWTIQRLPTCEDSTASVKALLTPHLIKLAMCSGMPLESAFRFALEFHSGNAGQCFSLQAVRNSNLRPTILEGWFPCEWWTSLRASIIQHVDHGGSLVTSLDSLGRLWFSEWNGRVKGALKQFPYKLLLPLSLLIIPAALVLMFAPFVSLLQLNSF